MGGRNTGIRKFYRDLYGPNKRHSQTLAGRKLIKRETNRSNVIDGEENNSCNAICDNRGNSNKNQVATGNEDGQRQVNNMSFNVNVDVQTSSRERYTNKSNKAKDVLANYENTTTKLANAEYQLSRLYDEHVKSLAYFNAFRSANYRTASPVNN